MLSLVAHLVSQDLSIAGKRAGLSGERSGLFMEQIRVIREMRAADEVRGRTGQFIQPRFMVWENVPGAFSSNKGNDFRSVLEETIRIADQGAPDIPLPPKGKWPLADCWMGDGWSVAYRVLDAQFWGVPQRRRRIALVADFGGHAAPEILFVRESVCGDTVPGGTAREETAAGVGSGSNTAISFQERAGKPGGGKGILIQKNRTGALSTLNNQYVFDVRGKVRRLTPMEYERLQGYPDGWTDIGPWMDGVGKLHKESSDSARYKALGNSIALPPWKWVIKRLCACYERNVTMASLFDGIGGFPLIWERLNGQGSCLWASEIEDFSIAVTKYHF